MSENPYASPEVANIAAAGSGGNLPLAEIARSTFLAWEKLRLFYNGVLVALVLILAFRFGAPRFLMTAIEGAVVANLCYFAGPALETYVTWLGGRTLWLRWGLFAAGTLLACVLAAAALFGALLPNQN